MPGLTAANGSVLAEAASVCLEDQSHHTGVIVVVDGSQADNLTLTWDAVTDQQRRTYADLQEATEWGACGIGIIAVCKQTGQVVVERSRKGTGFDYWFGEEDDDLFQNKTRFESSGILNGDGSVIGTRVKQKLEQVKASSHTGTPAYVSVVEFSGPRARVVIGK
ncbi:MAG TPA: hypothetical protein VN577_21930 [Terriglobales bacterium]|nr:hypothetical protein [Terriglobales bacterium]